MKDEAIRESVARTLDAIGKYMNDDIPIEEYTHIIEDHLTCMNAIQAKYVRHFDACMKLIDPENLQRVLQNVDIQTLHQALIDITDQDIINVAKLGVSKNNARVLEEEIEMCRKHPFKNTRKLKAQERLAHWMHVLVDAGAIVISKELADILREDEGEETT
jgi:hypothetical protein